MGGERWSALFPEADLVLMLPIVAVVVYSPIGKAIAASIHAVADQMQARADVIRRVGRNPFLDAATHAGRGSVPSVEAAPPAAVDAELARRVQALEDELHSLREAVVMATFTPRHLGGVGNTASSEAQGAPGAQAPRIRQ